MKKDKIFSPYKTIGEVATKSDSTMKAHGMGIQFGDETKADAYGDFFTANTETGLRDGSDRPMLFEHWEDKALEWQIVGYAVYTKSEQGWEYDVEFLDTDAGRMAYAEAQTGIYKSSTGSAWNYTRGTWIYNAEIEVQRLDTWLVIEQTMTKRPADFWNPPIAIKSVKDFLGLEQILAPLLAERQVNLAKVTDLESVYQGLQGDISEIQKQLKSFEVKGIQLPDDIKERFSRLVDINKYKSN